MDLLRKARRLLRSAFPRPATIHLEEDPDGIIGTVTSRKFYGLTSRQRVDTLWDVLDAKLDEAERRRISLILAVTPTEARRRKKLANAFNGD